MDSVYSSAPLPLSGLQHVSRVCRDVVASAQFYSDVLGFTCIKRPSSFNFDGAWLFGYGLGIHLIKGEPILRPAAINPKADHLSFQCESLAEVELRLVARGMVFVQNTVEEDGVRVHQIFFHDPDNNMIEICNCDLLPIVPLAAAVCPPCLMMMKGGAGSLEEGSFTSSSTSSNASSMDFDNAAAACQSAAAYGGRQQRSLARSMSMGNFLAAAPRGLA